MTDLELIVVALRELREIVYRDEWMDERRDVHGGGFKWIREADTSWRKKRHDRVDHALSELRLRTAPAETPDPVEDRPRYEDLLRLIVRVSRRSLDPVYIDDDRKEPINGHNQDIIEARRLVRRVS